MEAARNIRQAVADVSRLREAALARPLLRQAVVEVKSLQSLRFAGTYADLLRGGPHADATRFFLEDLYSNKDYAERDAQFSRIAGAIERLFPAQVVQTAVALAGLHALTEDLDQKMGAAWLEVDGGLSPASRYVTCWRVVGRRADRQSQLAEVMDIGAQMARLTRTPGLRMMLRMMRGPASAAGMASLQGFLESGFDKFAAVAGRPSSVQAFLSTIERRESALIAMLFDADLVACETELQTILGQAR